jgi:hypothetical protein
MLNKGQNLKLALLGGKLKIGAIQNGSEFKGTASFHHVRR